jgi:hypothetical protein
LLFGVVLLLSVYGVVVLLFVSNWSGCIVVGFAVVVLLVFVVVVLLVFGVVVLLVFGVVVLLVFGVVVLLVFGVVVLLDLWSCSSVGIFGVVVLLFGRICSCSSVVCSYLELLYFRL